MHCMSLSNRRASKNRFRGQAGFSLLEIIIVLGIVGTLVGIILSRVSGGSDKAKASQAELAAKNIQQSLLQYQMDVGQYPSTAQGLSALVENPGISGWQGPYIDKDSLNDPWKHPFIYSLGADGIELISNGKSGVPNAEDSLHFLNGKFTHKGNNEAKE